MTSKDHADSGGFTIPPSPTESSFSFEFPPHHSVKTNRLLSDQKALAEAQLKIIQAASEASTVAALRAVRLARWANVIAVVAAVMATIAAMPVIVEALDKWAR